MDQIETEPKSEEAKQVPKMPNGALQNGTSSPDSGHPSSRNFSVTSGLSDGSFSTEDSGAHDSTSRSAAVPPAPAGTESEGPTEDAQVKGEARGKEDEEGKEPDVSKTAENTKTEATGDDMIQPLEEGLKTQETVESGAIKKEEDKDLDAPAGIKGIASETEKEMPHEDTSQLEAETTVNEGKTNATDESNTSKPQEVFLAERKEEISIVPAAPVAEKSLVFSADAEVSRATESYFTLQKDDVQVMTESDESPSAIEMEEIPKAKVSMVPWSRKGRCEGASLSDDSAAHVELRQEEEQGKPSPEGTESILSEEPEMESLYPNFDSLVGSESAKNEASAQESAGGPFSVSI